MWDEPRLWLIPWIALVAIVGVTPFFVRPTRGVTALYAPITFACWFHLLPSFVAGGLVLASGWTPPFFVLIPSPDAVLPLTLELVAIGFAALFAGFWLPLGRRLGERAGRLLPDPAWTPTAIVPAGLIVLAAAAGLYAYAFTRGLVGYQTASEPGALDAAIVIASNTFANVGTMLLLLAIVAMRGTGRADAGTARAGTRGSTRGSTDAEAPRGPRLGGEVEQRTGRFVYTAVASVAVAGWVLFEVVSSGRRGALLQFALIAGAAVMLSGSGRRRPRPWRVAMFAAAAVCAVIVGMAYGTTFRQIRGGQDAQAASVGDYAQSAADAAGVVADRGVAGNVTFALTHLAERLEIVSSVAVIVGNHDRLEPFEQAMGLQDNIRTSFASMLVPRIVWPEKPTVSDPRALAELYFGYRNSYAITPVADLYRNFGMLGVPVGMICLGLLLRFIYAALIEDRPPSIARSTAYVTLLMAVSYEGFFGAIVPTLLRSGLVLIVALGIVHAVVVCAPLVYAPAASPGAVRQRSRP
jgi:hypothetical protein